MEENAAKVRYFGGNEVKIPKSVMTGLGDYDRQGGKYPAGTVTLTYVTKKLSKDRAAQFYFDRNDVDETNYVMEAAALMAQFQAEHVIPEIDAYRYSEIAKAAAAGGFSEVYTPTKADIVSKILSAASEVQNRTGVARDELVLTLPFSTYKVLEQSTEIQRQFNVQNITKNGVNTQIMMLNGMPIVTVVSDRMKTAYDFESGATKFGFKPSTGAKEISFIVAAKSAPIAVSKTDNLKIFAPDVNQDGDGWKTQYRKYHDIWIKDNSVKALHVAVNA